MPEQQVHIAIVGAGNCASSLVQGLGFYAENEGNEPRVGLMHPTIGGYRVKDIEVVAAFDVSSDKVGQTLEKALAAEPNNTLVFAPITSPVVVMRGPTLDGLGLYMADITESEEPPVDVARVLRETGADVLVSYLPVGSQKATEWYAEQALEAGCAFVNCVPAFIASDPGWSARFAARDLPVIGDDIKSQVGATIVHQVLTRLFEERGARLERTYQLNFGGNADFRNMLERERLASKKLSKTRAVTSQLDRPMEAGNIHIGPSDYVPWLTDRKVAHIRMEGTGFGGAPLNLELKLEVWDSPNSAGVVIDAVRCAKLAMDRKIGGAIVGPSAYFMKSPPQQFSDAEARRLTEEFIAGVDTPRIP